MVQPEPATERDDDMSENTKSAWGNGDEAEKAAAETKGMDRKVADLETRSEGEKPGTFAEMLRAMAKASREDRERDNLTIEQKVERITAFARLYQTPAHARFNVGDLVTPSAGSGAKGHGEPHVVVELRVRSDEEEAIDTAKFPGTDRAPSVSNAYGRIADMRVLAIDDDGDVAPYWVESWQFEAWTAPSDKAA